MHSQQFAIFVFILIVSKTHSISVGIGKSDVTGPAAEVGMVSETFPFDSKQSNLSLY